MGIRVIGDDKRITVGIQPIEAGESGEGDAKPRASFAPVGKPIVFDEPDNESESDASGPSDFVDPSTITGADSDSSAPFGYTKSGRKRNRPVGSSARSASRPSTSKTTDSIAAMLFTVHKVAGSMLKMDFLKIPRADCEELAAAVVEVTELYDMPLLNEKGMAWANLAATMARVYIFDASQQSKAQPTLVKEAPRTAQPMPAFMSGNRG